jgi:hypothetical protein
VLYNPGGGANLRAPSALPRIFDAHPELPWRAVSGPDSVAEALVAFAAAGVDPVVVSGGDGTVQATLSVLYGDASPYPAPPRLAVLRSGTTNMIANDAGLAGRPPRALARLLALAAAAPERLATAERHVIRVELGAARAPVCGMYVGAATIVQGVAYCKRNVHRVGLRGEVAPGVTLARFALAMARGDRRIASPVPVGVALDGGARIDADYLIVQVTTLDRLFLGLRPFWGTEAAPLRYTSVRARPDAWLRALPALLRGRPNRLLTVAHGYASRNATSIALRLADRLVVDGELFEPAPGETVILRDAGVARFVRLP